MKALSITQPWAQLILDLKKDIEIRTWRPSFRGRFLIHAPKTPDIEAHEHFGYYDKLETGALLGICTLDEVITYNTLKHFEKDLKRHRNYREPDKYPQQGLVLKDVEPLDESIPFKGQLNFFETGLELRGEVLA